MRQANQQGCTEQVGIMDDGLVQWRVAEAKGIAILGAMQIIQKEILDWHRLGL